MSGYLGHQFGNYRLIKLIGQGGFADVYLGEHIHLNTFAAIKILQMRIIGNNLEQFRNEARTIARLAHPNIIRGLDFDVEDDIPYLVMEYAPNGTLRQLHPKGFPLSPQSVVLHLHQAADALQYAHNIKLIHRDIKPENMLLGANNQVLLSDFGLVLMAHSASSRTPKEMGGTIPYMAPEQIRGKPRPASDQYALGIVGYEWLSGVRPFRGSQWEIISEHLSTPPPPLREKVPTIPSAIEEVVLQALAKDPQQRFVSVQAFATALEQASQTARQFHAASALSRFSSPVPRGTPSHPPSVHSHTVAEPNQSLVPVIPTMAPSQAPLSSLTAPLSDQPPLTSSSQTFPLSPVTSPSRQPASYPVWPPPSQPAIINQRRGLPRSQAGLLIGLVFLLVIGSAGLLSAPLNNYLAASHTTATANAYARATANAQATVTAADRPYDTATTKGVMFGFDPQHTHFNPYEKVLTPTNVSHLMPYWTASTGFGSRSSPAVANGVVYIGSYDYKLYAFTATTGKPLWTASLLPESERGT